MKNISMVLILFTLFQLVQFNFAEWRAARIQQADEAAHNTLQAGSSNKVLPDVYYIILDAYGRSDVLSGSFGVDNTAFLNSLREMNFFVAECSQSNYAHTRLSLASSLNYNYLDMLGDDFTPGNDGWSELTGLIRKNAIRRFLENQNYRVIAFETGYAWTEWRDADSFIVNDNVFFSKNLSPFETLFLDTTIGAALLDLGWIPEPQKNIRHYERILSHLKVLENMVEETGPKFVFAHLVIPHHPFVFDSDGGYLSDPSVSPAFENYTDDEYYNGYRRQVFFINERILKVVESILSNSKTPPIIVIQGDHGPSHVGIDEHVSILNAYYLPGEYNSGLYAKISPVNTFRVILNNAFDQSLPLLPDTSYFSKNSDPYSYKMIPNECEP